MEILFQHLHKYPIEIVSRNVSTLLMVVYTAEQSCNRSRWNSIDKIGLRYRFITDTDYLQANGYHRIVYEEMKLFYCVQF